MSKILFSVLCVLLSFVMLFSFVRASFGVERLSARQFVEEVANISTDFSHTKDNLQSLKDAFNKLEFPKWDELDLNIDAQDELRRENGNVALFLKSKCTIKSDGTLIAPNGACYTSSEYTITSNGQAILVDLGFFGGYTLFDELLASLKSLLSKNDDGFLGGILKAILYINSFFEYIDNVFAMFLELIFAFIGLVKDTVFFVVDVVLFLLKMLGIDTVGKIPST